MSARGCGRLDDVVAGLALGLLDGAERAAALAHIERCGDCQAEVAALTAAGEQLLLLAPEVPPPAGFESRVLARIAPVPEGLSPLGPSGTGRPRWWRRRAGLLAAAAVVMAVVMVASALLLAPWRGPDGSGGGAGVEVAAAEMLSPTGDVVGQATLWQRSPPVMDVDLRGWVDAMEAHGGRLDDQWWLSVQADDGAMEMYPVSLSRQSRSQVTLREGTEDVTTVALVDADGRAWCTGQFAG